MPSGAQRDFVIREFEEGDEVPLLEAFNRVFASVDPNFVPRSLEHWRWEFRDNPDGSAIWLALDGERIVGQYAGIRQRVLLEGVPATFLHGVDSMTDPAVRRSLTKGGLFARLGNTFLDAYGGRAPERVPVIWGPPIPSAWRVGKTLISYVLIRTQLKLCLAPGELRAGPDRGVEIEEARVFPGETAELFARAAPAHGAILVRDAERLNWRFGQHPERDYAVALARRGGQLVGYAVACRADFDGVKDELILCDWLVPEDEPGATRALLAWLAANARARDAERVTAILPDTCAAWLALQEAGFRARPTRYLIAARVYDPRYDERWLHRHFYYTLGDMDLV